MGEIFVFFSATVPDGGVPDMTRLTVLNEEIINKNLKVRYNEDRIYVSFFIFTYTKGFCLIRSYI